MGPSAMSALRHSPVENWRLGRMPSIAFAFLVVALHSGTSLADAAKEGTYLYTFTDQAKAIRMILAGSGEGNPHCQALHTVLRMLDVV